MKKTLPIDILTACDGQFSEIEPLLRSLAEQTIMPARIVILLYATTTTQAHSAFEESVSSAFGVDFFSRVSVVSSFNSGHQQGNYHGYDRAFLLECALHDQVLFIDGDNRFAPDFLERLLAEHTRCEQHYKRPCIVSPTVMFRETGTIQSQGITGFLRWFPKYQYSHMDKNTPSQEVMMIGANSLFGPTRLFRAQGFDARFAYCYEDIDFSYGLYRKGAPIVVLNTVQTNHMERRTSALQKRFLQTPTHARYRSRNRILFAKKHATLYQKILYFSCGVRIQTAGFLAAVLIRSSRSSPKTILTRWRAILGGTWNGLVG